MFLMILDHFLIVMRCHVHFFFFLPQLHAGLDVSTSFSLSLSLPPPPPPPPRPPWFIRPSSLVHSFMSVFNCIAFLYMLFSLTEWTVSLFMHYPSIFLGILSARCSSV